MPTRLRLSCRALLIIVLVTPYCYSAEPQVSHQLNPALDTQQLHVTEHNEEREPSRFADGVGENYRENRDRNSVTIRYDTTCYFNVRSKADVSRLNLPHGTDN